MANILYGVQGVGHGHSIRAMTIAHSFPQHNFLFVSDRDGYNLLRPEYDVCRLAVNESLVSAHSLTYSGSVYSFCKNLCCGRAGFRKTMQRIDSFKPDVAITDYEPNLPGICRTIGLSCLSLDHQHVIRFGKVKLPANKNVALSLFRMAIWMQFQKLKNYMIISFFAPPIKAKHQVEIFPPIFRQQVLDRTPSEGDHILAYHGYTTTSKFHTFLSSLPYPVRCYGMGENRVVGNVTYKKNSTDHFLDDLASCRYVMGTAGHTLLSEALFYGKPVMAFPIRNACEQFINGYYLEKNGYGLMNDAFHPSENTLAIFENNQESYKKTIQEKSFFGNEKVIAVLDRYFTTKKFLI